ncbi:hypothetical protein PV325_010362, partial [Microctonus aethiopoides]
LRSDADILQIAAKSGESILTTFINPVQRIDSAASDVTMTVPLPNAVEAFYAFLKKCNKSCLLVAHNAKFDVTRILNAIENSNMLTKFQTIVYGFCDSLNMLKVLLLDRKGAGKFKLCNLAKDILQIDEHFCGVFHEALFDVTILEALCASIQISIFEKNVKTVSHSYLLLKQSKLKSSNRPLLEPLKGVVSKGMLDKITSQNIKFSLLKSLFKERKTVLINYPTEKVDNKV